ncbi:class I SAM-dependent methyltransferase [Pseudonocardia humida]|uniref:Methyltransferase domain-containing protein n=1 Tax=Pseudonocardia humida TaxID=2800819 RepID=A0ABT1A0H0_9PSEU|nr:methyltransferase domain-containing protein [Pseudonocardia humida]MCO1656384.1 methyltransferase domain-containing protein [Pseudonocardia humida]
MPRTTDALTFALEFARSPWDVASLAPSAPPVCRALALPVPETGDPLVVELGAGSGVVTQEVRRRLGGRGRHLAVELNPRFAATLAERFPDVDVLHADARQVPDLLRDRGLQADVVISGLPWAAFPTGDAPSLHQRLAGAMTAHGAFTQLGYAATRRAGPARAHLAHLHALFEEVTTSRTVWRNLPPAVVHTARRPRPCG